MNFEQECFNKIKVGKSCAKYLISKISGNDLIYQTEDGYRGKQ
jgi:hypothetical protein